MIAAIQQDLELKQLKQGGNTENLQIYIVLAIETFQRNFSLMVQQYT